ncbi:hypothetical protein ACWD4P_07600 [Kitasatospora sp. NPDC002543]
MLALRHGYASTIWQISQDFGCSSTLPRELAATAGLFGAKPLVFPENPPARVGLSSVTVDGTVGPPLRIPLPRSPLGPYALTVLKVPR